MPKWFLYMAESDPVMPMLPASVNTPRPMRPANFYEIRTTVAAAQRCIAHHKSSGQKVTAEGIETAFK